MSSELTAAQLSSPIRDVPAAPVLAALLVVSLAGMAWRLRRGARFTWPRASLGVVACTYAVGVAKEVLQPFQIGIDRPFYPGWRAFVHLTPLSGTQPSDLALNALLFMPLGFLIPLFCRVRSLTHMIAIGLLLSLSIETTQLILDVTVSVGRVADVNDLIGDTVGTILGYVLLRLALSVEPVARLAAYVAWPAPPPSIDS